MYTYEILNYSALCEDGKEVRVFLEIEITLNGRGVSYRTFTGVAKCHPKDTFDFSRGVAVATLRAKQAINECLFEKNLALY